MRLILPSTSTIHSTIRRLDQLGNADKMGQISYAEDERALLKHRFAVRGERIFWLSSRASARSDGCRVCPCRVCVCALRVAFGPSFTVCAVSRAFRAQFDAVVVLVSCRFLPVWK